MGRRFKKKKKLKKKAERSEESCCLGEAAGDKAASLPVPAGGSFGQVGVSAPGITGDVSYVAVPITPPRPICKIGIAFLNCSDIWG